MDDSLLTYRGTVYPWQCDHMGHMNVMWYTGKFDEASWQMLARLGLTRAYMRERDSLMAAVQQNTSYKGELHGGDSVTIRSGIIEIRERVIRFFHEMRNDETAEVAALTVVTGVHMDRRTRRACAFPEDFLNRVQQHISEHRRDQPADIHDTLPQGPFPTNRSFSAGSLRIRQQ